MKHCMVDLETFGVRAGYAVRSIGAVMFDPQGLSPQFGKTFYENISRPSCEAAGLLIDPGTEEWWSRQSQAARDALAVNPQPLADVAKRFHLWFRDSGCEFAWAHGANFDLPIWEAASLAVKVPIPWKFWNARDTRTVFDLFDFDIRDIPRDGTYHDALDDARYQATCVIAALRKGRAPTQVDVFA